MADEIEPAGTTPEPVEAEPEGSLADHEAAFGETSQRPEPDPEPEPDESTRRPPRDTKTGQFAKSTETRTPGERRPKSHQAGPADVPRIAELTRKLREAEAERDALKTRTATPPAPPPVAPMAKQPEAGAAKVAEKPTLDKFADYDAYVDALTDWKIGEARRADRETAAQESARTALVTSWQQRVEGAKSKYPDFEQVALLAPTTIPQGSLVDAWILEHRSGADVLYSLQKDPGELQRILALPMFDQVEALSLLAQRLSDSPRVLAASTGAAAPPVKVAPRPPTPVRTSAVPAPDEPPGDEASLSEHEKFYPQRRR